MATDGEKEGRRVEEGGREGRREENSVASKQLEAPDVLLSHPFLNFLYETILLLFCSCCSLRSCSVSNLLQACFAFCYMKPMLLLFCSVFRSFCAIASDSRQQWHTHAHVARGPGRALTCRNDCLSIHSSIFVVLR